MKKLFWLRLAEETGDGTTTSGSTGGEDVTGLKNTIAALRQEIAGYKESLKQYEGIDPQAARTALTELPQVQEKVSNLSNLLNASKIDAAVGQVLTGAMPQYANLLASNVRGLLQVGEDGRVLSVDGKGLDDLRSEYQTKYPDMFAAASTPTGSGITPSAPTAPATATVVDAPKGIIQGVDPDAIISGTVKVNPI
jgi:hypothetical protein